MSLSSHQWLQKNSVWLLIACIIAVGFAHFLYHRDMPIVRNSAVYARIIDHLESPEIEFNASEHGFKKPLGFAYLSLPWTKLWGGNTGIQFSGFLFTALWVLSLIPFYRRLGTAFQLPENQISLFIFIVCFNPLAFYQFMAGYPDVLFAFSYLWGMYFLDRVFSKDIKTFDALFVGVTFLFSVWVKHNGFILLPTLVIFFICRLSTVAWLWNQRRKDCILAIVSFVIFFVIIALAQEGHDFNLFNFSHNKSNFTQGTHHLHIIQTNLGFFLSYFLLTLSLLFPLVIPLRKWHTNKEWYICIIIFLIALLYYKGTKANVRYYLTLAPFFALIVLANLQALPVFIQRTLLAGFVIINSYSLLYYNSIGFNAVSKNFISLPWQDNLRLTEEQQDLRKSIELINSAQKKRGIDTLFFLSKYYGTGLWYTWENAHFFNEGLKILYWYNWNDSLWQFCQCNEALVFDYNSSSYKQMGNRAQKKLLTKLGNDVYLARRPAVDGQ